MSLPCYFCNLYSVVLIETFKRGSVYYYYLWVVLKRYYVTFVRMRGFPVSRAQNPARAASGGLIMVMRA